MTFNTILDDRLHVAADVHYQGSINSYNNFFTRLTKHVGFSSDVMIGGKVHCLNNKSYLKFLQTLGIKEANLTNLRDYRNLDSLDVKLISNRGTMRSHLTREKVQALGRSLVIAIQDGDIGRAKNLLSAGAEINQTFWIRQNDGQLTFGDKMTFPIGQVQPFKATAYTPLLFAASKGLAVVDDLLRFGADTTCEGKSYIFSRDVENVKNDYNLEPLHIRTFVQSGNYINNQALLDQKVIPGLRLDGVKKEIISLVDRRRNNEILTFTNGQVVTTKRSDLDTEIRWQHEGNIERVRII